MKTAKILTILILALGLMVWLPSVSQAVLMGTAFTYQGRLIDANSTADGLYDFQFKLFDDPNIIIGNQIGSDVNVPNVDVIDGYFTVELDFGVGIFIGDARWLEIGVRDYDPCDVNAFIGLSPRQEMTPSPYAIYAQNAENADTVDGYDAGNSSGEVAVSNGIVCINLNADKLDGQEASAFAGIGHNHDAAYINDSSGEINTASDFAFAASTFITNLDADFLDGQHGSYYRNASNLNAGTISEARLPQNAIDGSEIEDNSLTASDIATNGVGSSEIQDNSITQADIATDGVGAAEIVANAVGSPEIVDNSITQADIATNGVGSAEIANGSVTASDMADGATLGEILDDDGSGSGLDADLLDGQHGSYYRNATNINSGTLSNARFSAYSDLSAEGKIGTGSTQVAAGNHGHARLPSFFNIFNTSATIVNTGQIDLYWNNGTKRIEVRRDAGADWSYMFISGNMNGTYFRTVTNSTPYNCPVMSVNGDMLELHVGQPVNNSGMWCDMWIVYTNMRLSGHYILTPGD